MRLFLEIFRFQEELKTQQFPFEILLTFTQLYFFTKKHYNFSVYFSLKVYALNETISYKIVIQMRPQKDFLTIIKKHLKRIKSDSIKAVAPIICYCGTMPILSVNIMKSTNLYSKETMKQSVTICYVISE